VTQKTQKVYLGHLSKENNFAELAYETVKVALTKPDFLMEVAKRDCISSITKVS
jgi:phosphoribosyl 1,2-cyclic phosphodiesterase